MTNEMLVIVPTRGRPHAVRELWKSWNETDSTEHADLLIAVDDDDPALYSYLVVASELKSYPSLRWRVGPRRRLSGTLNASAVEHAPNFRYLAFLGDDHRPRTRGWAGEFIKVLSEKPGIVYGNDLLRGEALPTAVAMTSDIVQVLGYMCPPELVHLFLDNTWLDWGKGMDSFHYLADVVVEHMHPAAGKAENDQGYLDVNSPEIYSSDGKAYQEYCETRRDSDIAKLRGLR